MKALDARLEERLKGRVPGFEGLRRKLQSTWGAREKGFCGGVARGVSERLARVSGAKGVFDFDGIAKWTAKEGSLAEALLAGPEKKDSPREPRKRSPERRTQPLRQREAPKVLRSEAGYTRETRTPALGLGRQSSLQSQREEEREKPWTEESGREEREKAPGEGTKEILFGNREEDSFGREKDLECEKGVQESRGESIFRVETETVRNESQMAKERRADFPESKAFDFQGPLLKSIDRRDDSGHGKAEIESGELAFEARPKEVSPAKAPSKVDPESSGREPRHKEPQRRVSGEKEESEARKRKSAESELAFDSVDFSDSNFEADAGLDEGSRSRLVKVGRSAQRKSGAGESEDSAFASILTDFVSDPLDFRQSPAN